MSLFPPFGIACSSAILPNPPLTPQLGQLFTSRMSRVRFACSRVLLWGTGYAGDIPTARAEQPTLVWDEPTVQR